MKESGTVVERKPTRNHGTGEDRLPTLESMPQVYAMTGMPVGLIKSLKQMGCPAFVAGNRIRLGQLLKFFFSQYGEEGEKLPDGVSNWREQWNKMEALRAELKLKEERGGVIEKDDVSKFVASLFEIMCGELRRLMAELPREGEMQSREKLKVLTDAKFADIVGKLEEKVKAL